MSPKKEQGLGFGTQGMSRYVRLNPLTPLSAAVLLTQCLGVGGRSIQGACPADNRAARGGLVPSCAIPRGSVPTSSAVPGGTVPSAFDRCPAVVCGVPGVVPGDFGAPRGNIDNPVYRSQEVKIDGQEVNAQ